MSENSLQKHRYAFDGFLDSLKTDYICEGGLPATIHSLSPVLQMQ